MRILLVEDSVRLQHAICAALRQAGFAVDVSGDGVDGLWRAASGDHDVVILDLMLPKLDGLEVLQRLRLRDGGPPVLVLTARDSVDCRVRGLQAGADDYLVKPFALAELLARVQALCRRRFGVRRPRVTVGDLELDLTQRMALRAGKRLDLTPRELMLLELLALRQGEVVTREEIERALYDERVEPVSNVVDTLICRLRRKVDPEGQEPLLHTRRGLGYILEPHR